MDPSRVYQYSNPGKVIFGPKALEVVKTEIGPREIPLVTTDGGIARLGFPKRIADLLKEIGVTCHIFDGVEPDPPLEVVEKAAALYRGNGCTLVIGLGGGSSIDTAKAVAVRVSQEGSLRDYSAGKPMHGNLPPIYAIPTTAGTGSEATSVAIISDLENKFKMPVRNPQLTPKVAVLDPCLLAAMHVKVAAETGVDALSHAIESYVGSGSHAISDAMALASIQMIWQNVRKFMTNPTNENAAGQMLLASYMAGACFNNAGLGLVHALAHPVGAYFHVPHGLACALYLPAVMKFNAPVCEEKFAFIADAMGQDVRGLGREVAAEKAVHAVSDLLDKMGLSKKVSELGIEFRLDSRMVDEALTSFPAKNNPRKADRSQIVEIFESAA